MKKFFALTACALVASASFAQSPKAQLKMDEGKFAEALPIVEAEIAKNTDALKAATDKAQAKGKTVDPTKFNAKYAGLYNQAAQCWERQYLPELDKATKSLELDTLGFASASCKAFESALASVKYDQKGKFVENNKAILNLCIDYGYYAGIFLIQSGHKAEAADFFEKYVAIPQSPIFDANRETLLAEKKENFTTAGYVCAVSNYELKRWDKVLAALQYDFTKEENARDLYLMKAEAMLETTKDSAQYEGVIKDAILKLENNSDFVNTLIGIYADRNDADGALAIADEFLATDPKCKDAWYIKGYVNQNMKTDYPAAREAFAKALEIDPNFVLANANMAYAWTNEVVVRRQNGEFKYYDKRFVPDNKKAVAEKETEEVRAYYRNALPYMEKVRELAPDRSKVWAPALQQIYANLGMDDEAKQMDDIMDASRQ